jgi:general secretion pathway protein G
MVELLMVIVIIAILIGLLVPAVQRGVVSAREAAVMTEIRQLETAIASFKATYGVEPPSTITFAERSSQIPTASQATIRRIWPHFAFTGGTNGFGNEYDLDNDGNIGEDGITVVLRGSECLVFFLGGARATNTLPTAMVGFSKNPANPFAPAAANESRDGPFFDFKTNRLVASLNVTPPNPPGGVAPSLSFVVYLDPLPGQEAPYVYASSYDGRGYVATDIVVVTPIVAGANNLGNVYLATAAGTAQKNKSFQIISPGYDHLYGSGGLFNTTATNNGLASRLDYDNLTNFHSGRLKP